MVFAPATSASAEEGWEYPLLVVRQPNCQRYCRKGAVREREKERERERERERVFDSLILY